MPLITKITMLCVALTMIFTSHISQDIVFYSKILINHYYHNIPWHWGTLSLNYWDSKFLPITKSNIPCILCNNWFLYFGSTGKSLELDSSKIKFSSYKTGREQMVQSGNLDSLLQRLTTVGYSGMAFINTFLTTFPLFTDAHTVMDFLIDSWYHCLKPHLSHARSAYTFPEGVLIFLWLHSCMFIVCVVSLH